MKNLDVLYARPGHLVRRCHQICVSLFLDECGPFDITPIQYAVLAALEASPGIEQIKLAGLVALDRSSTGYVIDRLEARALVRRQPCPSDRRLKRISLTLLGEVLIRDMHDYVERAQERILAPLNREERVQFMKLLTRMADVNNEFSRAPLVLAEKRLSA